MSSDATTMAMDASVGRKMLANVVGFCVMATPAAAVHAQVPGGSTRQQRTCRCSDHGVEIHPDPVIGFFSW
jgi:hypothetical protein